MNFTLERLLIAIQVTLLVVKITNKFPLPWVWALAPLWGGLLICFVMAYIQGYKENRNQN